MTNPTPRHESTMLNCVRQWRKDAFESMRRKTEQQRKSELDALAKQFGLIIAKTSANSRN
jgi:hypothetical protein